MKKLLIDSVEVLKSLRAELHDKVECSVIKRFDETIRNLEALGENDTHQYNATEILTLLGTMVELIPSIGKAVEYLMQMLR